jgi:hypothetical protein
VVEERFSGRFRADLKYFEDIRFFSEYNYNMINYEYELHTIHYNYTTNRYIAQTLKYNTNILRYRLKNNIIILGQP